MSSSSTIRVDVDGSDLEVGGCLRIDGMVHLDGVDITPGEHSYELAKEDGTDCPAIDPNQFIMDQSDECRELSSSISRRNSRLTLMVTVRDRCTVAQASLKNLSVITLVMMMVISLL